MAAPGRKPARAHERRAERAYPQNGSDRQIAEIWVGFSVRCPEHIAK
jgi:hypothetical protein